MDLHDAEILAKSLISQYNPGVRFAWSRSKRTFGDYSWRTSCMRLSRILTALRPEYEVRNTIMHEIAHSLCSPGSGHSLEWRLQMIKFGLKPERCSQTEVDLATLPGNWYAECPTGHKLNLYRLRKPRRMDYSCNKCNPGRYDARFKVIWKQVPSLTGTPASARVTANSTTTTTNPKGTNNTMATIEIVKTQDDLDPRVESGVETVTFFDPSTGEKREIELGEQNRKHFASHLEKLTKYLEASRLVVNEKPKAVKNDDNAKIRAWALANGYQIGDRGRIKAEIVEAYRKAEAAEVSVTDGIVDADDLVVVEFPTDAPATSSELESIVAEVAVDAETKSE